MMKSSSFPRRLLLASLLAAGPLTVPTFSLAQAPTAEVATANAMQLMNEGKFPEAAEAFEKVAHDYPTATSAPDAQFRVGYLNYLTGNYSKSLDYLKKVLTPPAPDEIIEMGYALIPQVLSAQAGKETDDAKRKAGFEDAIKKFDDFLQRYPKSSQVETTNYSRAVACFQIAKYDDAAQSLQTNLKSFPNSESILDSQYLLALVNMTQAGMLAQETPDEANPTADAKFNEAEKLLADIIAKHIDIALVNDAQFQLGELYLNRALFAPQDGKAGFYNKALIAYRGVLPKEGTVEAQQKRIGTFRERHAAAVAAKNLAEIRRISSLIDYETTKLATLKAKGDQTVSAQIKIGEIFFYQKAYDEARVLFTQMQNFAEDDDQKKTLLYFLTLSYGLQAPNIAEPGKQPLVDRAVENYKAFESAFKADPMGDNLPLTVGSLFLVNEPAKAVEFFQEGITLYPKGRVTDDTFIAQADAFVRLERFDEALGTFKKFLTQKLKPEQAARAEFGIASILKDTNKTDEAIAQYKKVASTFPQMKEYAEQSSFFAGYLAYTPKNDFAAAITDLAAFLKDYPQSELAPTAKLGLGASYAGKGDKESAMRILKELADEFPKSDAAPYGYFQRSAILAGDGKNDENVELMKEFIAKYPDHEQIFNAYNTIGQIQSGKAQLTDAIATYNEMAEKHPQNPNAPTALSNVISLWIQYAGAQGPYFAMNEEQRAEWNKALKAGVETGEKLLATYPESAQAAGAIQNLLAAQRLYIKAKLKTDEDITKYFQDLAGKFTDKPQTRSKILFTLASFTYERDKAAAVAQMTSAYDPSLVYASADMDLYGSALLEQGKVDDSIKIYQKLAENFPNDPAGPDKSSPEVQEAQSISIYGLGKALQKQGDVAAAAEKFDTLKKLYPWSPKIMEANFGIAESFHKKGQDEQAIPLLTQIAKTPSSPIELRAGAMLLFGKILEDKNDLAGAISQYLKISVFFDSVASAASEGLWRGGQLLEKQAATLPDSSKDPKQPLTKPGQMQKAIKAYSDLAQKYPNSEHANAAKARLAELKPSK